MNVMKVFAAALAVTGYPVTQRPVQGTGNVYLCYEELLGRLTGHSSNRPRRIRHSVQVDVFTRQPPATEIDTVIAALRAAGISVQSWGPTDYEAETRLHHVPITCEYTEDYTEQEE